MQNINFNCSNDINNNIYYILKLIIDNRECIKYIIKYN